MSLRWKTQLDSPEEKRKEGGEEYMFKPDLSFIEKEKKKGGEGLQTP